MSEIALVKKELSYKIMQAAYEVHNTLGPGFPVKIKDTVSPSEATPTNRKKNKTFV